MLIDTSTGSASTLNRVEWVDTHAHLNLAAFNKDRKEVIKRCLDNDVWAINVGTNFETSRKAVEIAEGFEKGMLASVGLHPINLDTGLMKKRVDKLEGGYYEKEFDYEKYKNLALGKNLDSRSTRIKELASSEKVVAIGEVGLDYYWKPKTTGKKELFKNMQKDLLLQELTLAKELNLPVIFHCRMAHEDLIKIFSENQKVKPKTAIAHSFVGGVKELKDFLNLGFYIGFNGMIYKKIEGVNFEKVIKETPLDKILIETDCPYLTPPEADAKRNEPIFVKYIAKKIAEIKKISPERLAEVTTQNARKVFNM